MFSLNNFSLSNMSGMQIFDFVIAIPGFIFVALILVMMVFSKRFFEVNFVQFIRRECIAMARAGQPLSWAIKYCVLYIGLTLVLYYIGSVWFAWTIAVIAFASVTFTFYYAWIVEQHKAGKLN